MESGERTGQLYKDGSAQIARMRELVSGSGPIKERSDAFGAEALRLVGTIAALEQSSMAPAVKRAADDMGRGFIAPAADGRTADLAGRQNAVVGNVEKAVAVQARALSQAADGIIGDGPVQPARFQPLSTAEAVLRYAGDFLPSWAGAISIDLLPAVLVLALCVVHAAIRREDQPADAETMTAAQLITAMRLLREVKSEEGQRPGKEEDDDELNPVTSPPRSPPPPSRRCSPGAAPRRSERHERGRARSRPALAPAARHKAGRDAAARAVPQPRSAHRRRTGVGRL